MWLVKVQFMIEICNKVSLFFSLTSGIEIRIWKEANGPQVQTVSCKGWKFGTLEGEEDAKYSIKRVLNRWVQSAEDMMQHVVETKTASAQRG